MDDRDDERGVDYGGLVMMAIIRVFFHVGLTGSTCKCVQRLFGSLFLTAKPRPNWCKNSTLVKNTIVLVNCRWHK